MFFLKRFALAFNPVRGYGALMNSRAGGAFGVLAVLTVISVIVLNIGVGNVMDKVMVPAEQAFMAFPEFSISNGQLNMPNIPQPVVQQSGDWMFVFDSTSGTTTSQMPPGKSWVLITRDKIYTKTPNQNHFRENPLSSLNGATKQNAAAMLKKNTLSLIGDMMPVIFLFVLVIRILLAGVVGGLISLVPVDGDTKTFKQAWSIAAHAQVPAIAVDWLYVGITASTVTMENIARIVSYDGVMLYIAITAVTAFWAHFKANSEEVWV